MRYLRTSVYPPRGEPVTTVLPEDQLKLPIEMAANQMREAGYPPFVDIEIFDGPEELIQASVIASEHAKTRLSEEERHQGTMHDWAIALLYVLRPGGLAQTKDIAPLDGDVIRDVLLDVSRHPQYRNQTYRFRSQDGKSVVLEKGTVIVRD